MTIYCHIALMVSDINRNLAQNLEYLRKARGITQAQLQKLSGVPRTTISNIESGNGNPTLSVLNKISTALGITLEELVSKPTRACRLFSVNDLKYKKRTRGQVMLYDLLPKPIPGLQFERLEFKAESMMVGVPHSKGTREFFTPTKGNFVVVVDGTEYRVKQSEVFAFPGDLKHSYKNTENHYAQAISVVVLDSYDW